MKHSEWEEFYVATGTVTGYDCKAQKINAHT